MDSLRNALRAPLRNTAHWLGGAAVLLGCNWLGGKIGAALSLPLPGSVLGMLLLLCGLIAYGGVPRGLAQVSGQLLRLLVLLFLPAAVGVFYLRDLSAADWLGLLAATVFGTLLSLILCALLLTRLLKRRGEGGDE